MNGLCKLLFVMIAVLLDPPATRGQEAKTPKMPPLLHQILNWLPNDSETLVVANGPFDLPAERADVRPFLESARALSFGLATHLQRGLLTKQLQGKKVLIAVEASRRFTSPHGLGMMPFEGCQILKFDASAHEAVHAAVDSCIERAPKTIRLGDTRVAIFTEKWERDEWSLFVAEPVRGTLLCATNQEFLEQLLARMDRENHGRAFPDNLLEWEHLHLEAPVWGIRHYRNDFADSDPSSPLRPKAAANVADSKAIGFVFYLDARSARARYLSGADHAAKFVTQRWSHPVENLRPTIKEVRPGVIEIVTPVTGDEDGGEQAFLFVLLAYLGHAVYL